MNKVIRNSKAIVLSVMCAAAIGATTASAQTPTMPADVAGMSDAQYARMYADMDTNKDGMISRAEYLAYHGMNYDRMDMNKKGMVSRQEMRDRMFLRELKKSDGTRDNSLPPTNSAK